MNFKKSKKLNLIWTLKLVATFFWCCNDKDIKKSILDELLESIFGKGCHITSILTLPVIIHPLCEGGYTH